MGSYTYPKELKKLFQPEKVDPDVKEALCKQYFEAKEKNTQSHGRKQWLEKHPEDRWIDDENQYYRRKGFDDDGLRCLMAAICLKACADYQRTLEGKTWEEKMPPYLAQVECRRFFDTEMMQYFTNGMDSKDIAKDIRSLPQGYKINAIWRSIEK